MFVVISNLEKSGVYIKGIQLARKKLVCFLYVSPALEQFLSFWFHSSKVKIRKLPWAKIDCHYVSHWYFRPAEYPKTRFSIESTCLQL